MQSYFHALSCSYSYLEWPFAKPNSDEPSCFLFSAWQITKKCLPAVLQLPHLEDLALVGCLSIDDEGLISLKQECKSLQVCVCDLGWFWMQKLSSTSSEINNRPLVIYSPLHLVVIFSGIVQPFYDYVVGQVTYFFDVYKWHWVIQAIGYWYHLYGIEKKNVKLVTKYLLWYMFVIREKCMLYGGLCMFLRYLH